MTMTRFQSMSGRSGCSGCACGGAQMTAAGGGLAAGGLEEAAARACLGGAYSSLALQLGTNTNHAAMHGCPAQSSDRPDRVALCHSRPQGTAFAT